VAQRGRGGKGGRGGGGGRGTPMVGAPLAAILPPTTKATMATRIEQLEQRLATMASFQHRSHLGGEVPTSYGGNDLFYMASVAQIEVFIAMTRGVTRASEPRGATVELDPQRGETSRMPGFPNHSYCLRWLGFLPWFLHHLSSRQWGQRHQHHM
jgi:hypothetical protein